jgi:hypothetical protein
MPTKQEIEAELNASEKDRAIAEARATLVELSEFETMLRAAEREIWQPHWNHDDPLVDRLARIGISKELIAQFQLLLDHMSAVASGEPIPAELQKMANDISSAEASASQQLAAIFAKGRR